MMAFPKRARVAHIALTDAIIIKFVDVHGPRWRDLSRSLGGREAGYSDDVVRNRYIRMLEAAGTPYEPRSVSRKTPAKPDHPVVAWSELDDELIIKGIDMYGPRWYMVASLFDGKRTTQAVRNRANRIGAAPKCLLSKKECREGACSLEMVREQLEFVCTGVDK